MKIRSLDHLVLTTQDLNACIAFYVKLLNMELLEKNGRYALKFGTQKINIHTRKGEFQPAAGNVQYGSLDLCLIVDEPIEAIYKELQEKGADIEQGIVDRTGAMGPIRSIYLRDPDQNLVEIASYTERYNLYPLKGCL